MNLLFGLKIFADVAYLFYALGSILSRIGLSDQVALVPFALGICAGVSGLLLDRFPKNRLPAVPVSLLPLLLIPVLHKIPDLILLGVGEIYLFVCVMKRGNRVDYETDLSRFYVCLRVAALPLFIAIIIGNWGGFKSFMLVWMFFYLAIRVLMLRMLRHADRVTTDRRFRLITLSEIGGICLVGALFSGDYILTALKFLWHCLTSYIIMPLITLFVYLLRGIVWVLKQIFGEVKIGETDVLQNMQEAVNGWSVTDGLVEEADQAQASKTGTVIAIVIICIGVAILVTLLILLIRYLAARGDREQENDLPEEREALGPGDMPRRDKRLTGSKRDRVRQYYRRFLHMAQNEGMDLDLNLDTREIGKAARFRFHPPSLDALRNVYVRARYSTEEITGEDVDRAKQAYDRLKKDRIH